MAPRLAQLVVGLLLCGFSMAALVRSRLGNDPWNVLHEGIAIRLGLPLGTVVVAASFLVLLAWIPLRELPGVGTVANAVLIGTATQWGVDILVSPSGMPARLLFAVGGVLGVAVGTALYLGVQLGAGPRDGLMTGIHHRTGVSLRSARTAIEGVVVMLGIALGGTFGPATLAYAVTIGPLVQMFLPMTIVPLRPLSHGGGA